MKKKSLISALVGLCMIALVGCGKDAEEQVLETTAVPAEVVVSNESTNVSYESVLEENGYNLSEDSGRMYGCMPFWSGTYEGIDEATQRHNKAIGDIVLGTSIEGVGNGSDIIFTNSCFNLGEDDIYMAYPSLINAFASDGLDKYYNDYATYTQIEDIMVSSYGVSTEFNVINPAYVDIALCDLAGLNGMNMQGGVSVHETMKRNIVFTGLYNMFMPYGYLEHDMTEVFRSEIYPDIADKLSVVGCSDIMDERIPESVCWNWQGLGNITGGELNYAMAVMFMGYEMDIEIPVYATEEEFLSDTTMEQKLDSIRDMLIADGYSAFETRATVELIDYNRVIIGNIRNYVTKDYAIRHYDNTINKPQLTDENVQIIVSICSPGNCKNPENEGLTANEIYELRNDNGVLGEEDYADMVTATLIEAGELETDTSSYEELANYILKQ